MIHKEFLGLAINNDSVPEILRTLRRFTGIPCAFMDTWFKNIFFSDEDSSLMCQLQDMDMENISSEFLNQYDNYAVANKNETFGYLLFEKGQLQTGEDSSIRIALEYASIVLILQNQVRISNQQMAEKYKACFINLAFFHVFAPCFCFLSFIYIYHLCIIKVAGWQPMIYTQ